MVNTLDEHREFKRTSINNWVQVRSDGRAVDRALAVNVSMGGLLLVPASPLPVGHPCDLAISLADGHSGFAVVARGMVVRCGERETAFQFLNALDKSLYKKVVARRPAGAGQSLVDAYSHYFNVSRDERHTGSERWFGVSSSTFRNVTLATFLACIGLAIAPVWLWRHVLTPEPEWLKILLSFCYGWIWITAIQPSINLALFRTLKFNSENRSSAPRKAPKSFRARPEDWNPIQVGSPPFRRFGVVTIGAVCALIACLG